MSQTNISRPTSGLKYDIEKLINVCFTHELQMKTYHFQTSKYGAHKASDDYVAKFRVNSDRLIEVAQGIMGKSKESGFAIVFNAKNDVTVLECLNKFIDSMRVMETVFTSNPEMLAIRDEIVADAMQFKYLLTFS